MKQTDKLFKEIIRISGDSYLDKYMYESGAAILEIYIDEKNKKISIEVESNLMFFNVPKDNDIVNRTCYIELEYLPNHLNIKNGIYVPSGDFKDIMREKRENYNLAYGLRIREYEYMISLKASHKIISLVVKSLDNIKIRW